MFGWIVKLVFRLIATLFTLLAYALGIVAFYGPSFLIAYLYEFISIFIGWGAPEGGHFIFAIAAPFLVLIWLALLEHSDIPPPPKFRRAYEWLSFPAKFFIKIAFRLDR